MENNNNIHLLSLFLNGIKMLGAECVEEALKQLTQHKATLQTNDVHPCPPGQIWSELQQKCVPDIG